MRHELKARQEALARLTERRNALEKAEKEAGSTYNNLALRKYSLSREVERLGNSPRGAEAARSLEALRSQIAEQGNVVAKLGSDRFETTNEHLRMLNEPHIARLKQEAFAFALERAPADLRVAYEKALSEQREARYRYDEAATNLGNARRADQGAIAPWASNIAAVYVETHATATRRLDAAGTRVERLTAEIESLGSQ